MQNRQQFGRVMMFVGIGTSMYLLFNFIGCSSGNQDYETCVHTFHPLAALFVGSILSVIYGIWLQNS